MVKTQARRSAKSASSVEKPAAKVKPRIVAAVGSAVMGKSAMSKDIERAMQQAIQQASKDGVGQDKPEEIKRRMMAARQKVIDSYKR